jgi:hypothetical protein
MAHRAEAIRRASTSVSPARNVANRDGDGLLLADDDYAVAIVTACLSSLA